MRIKLLYIFFIISSFTYGQGVRFLPSEIEMGESKFEFSFDNKNRFTCIKHFHQNEVYQYDSICYNGNRMMIYDYEGKLKECIEIKQNNEYSYSYMVCDNTELLKVTFWEESKMSALEYIEAKDNERILYRFAYDDAGNLSNVIIPDNVSLEYVNPVFQLLNWNEVVYDNKNGIFKNVNIVTSIPFLLNYNSFPYLLYLCNNMIDMSGDRAILNANKDSNHERMKYNEYGYPLILGNIIVKYTEAKL